MLDTHSQSNSRNFEDEVERRLRSPTADTEIDSLKMQLAALEKSYERAASKKRRRVLSCPNQAPSRGLSCSERRGPKGLRPGASAAAFADIF